MFWFSKPRKSAGPDRVVGACPVRGGGYFQMGLTGFVVGELEQVQHLVVGVGHPCSLVRHCWPGRGCLAGGALGACAVGGLR